MVEHAGTEIEFRVWLFEVDAERFDLVLEPRDALLLDNVLHACPDAVLAVAPLLMDIDDPLHRGEQVFGRNTGKGQGDPGKGGFAVFLTLTAADEHLIGDDFFVFDDRRDADLTGSGFDAVVADVVPFSVTRDGTEGDLELTVQQLGAIAVLHLRVGDIGRVDREDLDVRRCRQSEVGAILMSELVCVADFGVLREWATHDIADVVAATVECVVARRSDILNQIDEVWLLEPVILDVLAGGQAQ